jgi:hypothetical protein
MPKSCTKMANAYFHHLQIGIKSLIGGRLKDPEFQKEVVSHALFDLEEGKNGLACVKVMIDTFFFNHNFFLALESSTASEINSAIRLKLLVAAKARETKIAFNESMIGDNKSSFCRPLFKTSPGSSRKLRLCPCC